MRGYMRDSCNLRDQGRELPSTQARASTDDKTQGMPESLQTNIAWRCADESLFDTTKGKDGRRTLLSDVGARSEFVLHELPEHLLEVTLHRAVALRVRMHGLYARAHTKSALDVPRVRNKRNRGQSTHVDRVLDRVPDTIEVLHVRLEALYLLRP